MRVPRCPVSDRVAALWKKNLDSIWEPIWAPVALGSWQGHQLRTQASSSLMQNCSCRASTSLLKVAQGWLPPRYKSPSNHSPNWPLKKRESLGMTPTCELGFQDLPPLAAVGHPVRAAQLAYLPLNHLILNLRNSTCGALQGLKHF
jgi:hypothetical protein